MKQISKTHKERKKTIEHKTSYVKIIFVTSLCLLIPAVFFFFGLFCTYKGYELPQQAWEFLLDKDNNHLVEPTKETSTNTLQKQTVYTLYYIEDSKSKAFMHLFLEAITSKNNQILYLTIPLDTKRVLSSTLFEEIKSSEVSLPQILKLSMISSYFSGENAYYYGKKIVEEALNLKIDYYVTMSQEEFEDNFLLNHGIIYLNEAWQQWYEQPVMTRKTKERLEEYVIRYKTDRTILAIAPYLETYDKVGKDGLYFELIAGDKKNAFYELDEDEIKKRMTEFIQ